MNLDLLCVCLRKLISHAKDLKSRKEYEALRQHGEETYPHECCGVLLGQMDDDGVRTVTSVARAGNTRTDSATTVTTSIPKN